MVHYHDIKNPETERDQYMSHDIIDSRNAKLVDTMKQVLPSSQAAKFAVGYFFLSGLGVVTDILKFCKELSLILQILRATSKLRWGKIIILDA